MGRCGKPDGCLRRRIRVPADFESFERAVKDWMARCVASIRVEQLVSRDNLSVLAVWGRIYELRLVGSEVEIHADYTCRPHDNFVTEITFSLPMTPPSPPTPRRVETPVQPADRGTRNRGVTNQNQTTDDRGTTNQARGTPPPAEQDAAPHGIRFTYRNPVQISGVPRQVLNGEVGPINAFLFKIKIKWNAQWEVRVGSEDPRIEVIRTQGESVAAQINVRLQQDVMLRFSAEWQENVLTAIADMLAGRRPVTVEGLTSLLRPKLVASLATQDDAARVGRQEVRVGIETSSETPMFAEYSRRFRIVETAGPQGNLRCRVKFSLGLNSEGWIRLFEIVRERVRDAVIVRQLLRNLAPFLGSQAFSTITTRLGIVIIAVVAATIITAFTTYVLDLARNEGEKIALAIQYASGLIRRLCRPSDELHWWEGEGAALFRGNERDLRYIARRRGIEKAGDILLATGGREATMAWLRINFGLSDCTRDLGSASASLGWYLVRHNS